MSTENGGGSGSSFNKVLITAVWVLGVICLCLIGSCTLISYFFLENAPWLTP